MKGFLNESRGEIHRAYDVRTSLSGTISEEAMIRHKTQGALLKKIRERYQMTQKEMGELLGLSGKYIQKVETGGSPLSPKKWRKLSKACPKEQALDVCIADFITVWEKNYIA